MGSCEVGVSIAVLETSALSVPVRTSGSLFWDYGSEAPRDRYVVPRESDRSPVYAGSLWISGFVEDSLRVAATTYSSWAFWPGPLPDADDPPDDCSAYDRIWTVSRADLERYYETGQAAVDLEDWPVHLGAPVIDGDGDPGNYDLEGGDQPDLLGDVAAWWIMNDAGNEREFYGSTPIGVEVRAHAFAFEDSPSAGIPEEAVRYTPFLRYEIVNRRSVSVDSLRVSLWTDVDLGTHDDDYLGTDTLRHMVYVYNGDDLDEGRSGYGAAPPAWGVQVLGGVVGLPNGRDDDLDGTTDEPGEEVRLASTHYTTNEGPFGDPYLAEHFVNVQRGRGRFGARLGALGAGYPCEGGQFCGSNGAGGGPPTVYIYPSDPAAGEFWSEVNNDGQGGSNRPGERRMVLTTGPGRLDPGQSAVVTFAFPFARGADHLTSVTELRTLAGGLQATFGGGTFPSRPVARPEPPAPPAFALSRVRPNPTSRSSRAVLELPQGAAVEAVVYDALGRRVAVALSGTRPRGRVEISVPDGLAPGVYMLRVEVERARMGAVPFTVVR